MHYLLSEASLNVTTFRYYCLGFFLSMETHVFRYTDAITATFQVLININFLNYRLALLLFCLLIVLRAFVFPI